MERKLPGKERFTYYLRIAFSRAWPYHDDARCFANNSERMRKSSDVLLLVTELRLCATFITFVNLAFNVAKEVAMLYVEASAVRRLLCKDYFFIKGHL